MNEVTILDASPVQIAGEMGDGKVLIDPADLVAAIGWRLEPEGLCRGDQCAPVRNQQLLWDGDRVDLAAVAGAVGRPALIDPDEGLVVLPMPGTERRRALRALQAPSFALPDLDGTVHELEEWRGRKKLLVAFASW
ncbi:MAG: hypothetical protein KDB21_12870 [Acidimicrobiales bacterium]|nr:hypothetical protein [Acidimicrobiales bacterium]